MTYANLDGSKNDKTLADIIKWKLDLGPEKRRPVDPALDTPAPFVVNHGAHLAKAERASLTWIGHASFLVQLGGASILIDPVFSDRLFAIRRTGPAPGTRPLPRPRGDGSADATLAPCAARPRCRQAPGPA